MKKGETNNKRVLLLALIALFVWTAHIVAEPITKQQAQEIVQEFLVKRGKNITVSNLRHAPLRQAATTESFYVFNVGNNEGFVIAAGDDCAPAILGYSDVGSFNEETMPDNMKAWLEEYDRQIKFMQEHGQSSKGILKTPTRAAIAPLVNAKWSQDAPYNSMCPDGNYIDYDEAGYDTNNRCLTGCVATAMAQLMYYWEWPKDCPAIDGYEVDGHTIKVLPATTFKWGKMKDTYDSNETGEAVDAVAELMRYCGQAVKTKYGESGSGANFYPSVLMSTFQYSNGMHQVSRKGYSAEEWESIIYKELAAQRPVLYSGISSSGHQFIVDGYDGNGLFHINWGWGGYPDTYYVLSVADTEQSIAYQINQQALINVKPGEGGTVEVMVDGIKYLCSPGNKTAMVIHNDDADGNATSVTIPSSINVNGVDCKVTVIGDYAFNYWNQMEEIIIPEGVEAIESYAFINCFKLRKIVLPSTITYLGDRIFYGVDLDVIQSNIQEPPVISYDTFLGEENSLLTELSLDKYCSIPAELYVPVGSKEKYEAILGWARLPKIQEGQIIETMVGRLKYCCPSNGSTAIVLKDDSYWDEDLTEVIIPATIDVDGKTYQVTNIGTSAFNHSYIRSVSLPEGIEVIGVGALNGLFMTEITLPSTLKVIRDGAFAFNRVKSISIPEGVEIIGARAFRDMINLVKLELPNSLKFIGDRLIYGCNLPSVVSHITDPFRTSPLSFMYNENIPSPATLYVPVGTKSKYEAIDGWKRFTKIEEGEPKEGFVGNLKYSYSTAGTTATVIQDESYKSLTEAIVPVEINIDGRIYQVTAIGGSAFKDCSSLSTVSLPEGIEILGDYSFNQTCLSEITLPHSLKQIGKYAFFDCSSIKTVIVPEGVEILGEGAFFRMENLETIELPNSLEFIGIRVIMDDAKLTSVVSHITEPFAVDIDVFAFDMIWDGQDFNYPPSPATLYVPAGTKARYEALPGWTKFAKIEELPSIDPITEAEVVDFSEVINETTDLSNTVIDNTYYNLDAENGDGYDAEELAIVLNSTTTAEQINAVQNAEVGDVTLQENFMGIIFEVPAGRGTVTVDVKTVGTHVLNVQLGNNAPTKVTKAERGMAEVPFDVETPTYVYLYASSKEGNGARTSHAPSAAANSVLLYGFMVAVDAEPVIVTANSYTREYGEENPVFDYTVEGAALEGKPQITCEATKTSPVGTYPIIITKGSVTNDNDTYINGTLTIEKAPLTVKTEDASRTEGEENPTFVISYEGWKNGETEDVLTVKPTATTDATQSSPAGTYVIVVSGGDAQNYELLYQNGTLTVKEASCIYSISNSQSDMPADVYDLQGRIVRRYTSTLKNLPRGIYVVNGRKMVVK